MMWVYVVITVLFGVLRFIVPVTGKVNKQDIYKDMAHIFVGWLFGAWVVSMDHWFLVLGVSLTVLELVAAIARRKRD